MKTVHFVKHPSIAPTELDGARLAWLSGGTGIECRLLVQNIRGDGKYALSIDYTLEFDGIPNGQGSFANNSHWLDQTEVDKIERVDDGSLLKQQRFDFAIAEDELSKTLAHTVAVH